MQPLQNGVQYKPGAPVLRYFILPKVASTVIVFMIIGIALSFLQKAIASSAKIPHYFNPADIMKLGIPAIIILGVIIILYVCITSWIRYASIKFMFDEFAFHIQNGILSKSEVAIPYRQIKNVNYAQNLSEKTWGIAHVIVETIGAGELQDARSGGDLPILDATLAVALQQELLRRSSGK